ncbi:MAG: succinate dehydrogenase assembly factor 2 [Pseudomonadota bacterium]
MTPQLTDPRLKRLRMRAWHRGTKEMDLILGAFVDAEATKLTDPELLALEKLMAENDNDLYLWVSGAQGGPIEHAEIIQRIQSFHEIS